MSDETTARGDRSVAIGGDAAGSTIITGDVIFRAVESHAPGSAPPYPALFVGREQVLHDLKVRLGILPGQDGDAAAAPVQVVTAVRGWPGVGKTTLAAALAHGEDVAAALPDGVLWVALGPDPDVMTGLADWGRALGVDLGEYPTPEARSNRLAHLLRDQRRLLIVDDVWPDEHGQPTAAQPFCVGGRDCRTLITTRRADLARTLAGRAEAVYRLGVMNDDDARELLVKLVGPTVDTPALDEVVRALDGLPLALTVAGRLLAAEAEMGWGLDDLLAELDERGRILEEGTGETRPGLLSGAPLTVAAIFQLSTDCLPPEERARFALLGAFVPKPATWDTAAAAALWEVADARPTLRCLVDWGLVEPTGEGRFHLHALLADHARDLAGPDLETATHRHIRRYLAVAESATEKQQFADLDPEWPQLRAALEYAHAAVPLSSPEMVQVLPQKVAHKRSDDDFSNLVFAVNEYLSARGLLRDWLIWERRAAIACQALGYRWDEAVHRGQMGNAYIALGDSDQAIEAYQQALAIAHEIDDPGNENAWLGGLGAAYRNLGDHHRAIDYYEQALAIARRIGNRHNEASWLGGLGIAYKDLGDYDRASTFYQQALAIVCDARHGDRRKEGIWLGNLGIVHENLDDYARAIKAYQQALAIAREIGDRRRAGIWLGSLGRVYASQGHHVKALECHQQALNTIREIGDRRGEAIGCWHLGLLYAKQGDLERAAALMQTLVDYEREIGHLDAEEHAAYVAQLREGKPEESLEGVRVPKIEL